MRFTLYTVCFLFISQSSPLLAQWAYSSGTSGPIYYAGGNVGINTSNPAGPLQVLGSAFFNPTGDVSTFMRIGDGTDGNNIYANRPDGGSWFFGFDTNENRHVFRNYADGLWHPFAFEQNGGVLMLIQQDGKVGIGTTTPQYPLSVKGTIGAGEVIVTDTSGWSDYVFEPSFQLPPLSEVAAYVVRNHHLPGIPTSQEVADNGISIGEMQSKMLAEIEKLTLHMIEADERNSRLDRENSALQERVRHLEAEAQRRSHRGGDKEGQPH